MKYKIYWTQLVWGKLKPLCFNSFLVLYPYADIYLSMEAKWTILMCLEREAGLIFGSQSEGTVQYSGETMTVGTGGNWSHCIRGSREMNTN